MEAKDEESKEEAPSISVKKRLREEPTTDTQVEEEDGTNVSESKAPLEGVLAKPVEKETLLTEEVVVAAAGQDDDDDDDKAETVAAVEHNHLQQQKVLPQEATSSSTTTQSPETKKIKRLYPQKCFFEETHRRRSLILGGGGRTATSQPVISLRGQVYNRQVPTFRIVQGEGTKNAAAATTTTCAACHTGGDLMPCRGCRRSFHSRCLLGADMPESSLVQQQQQQQLQDSDDEEEEDEEEQDEDESLGHTYCVDCNALGTTHHLLSYFSECEQVRAEFDCSRHFVRSLLHLHMAEAEAAQGAEDAKASSSSSSSSQSANRVRSESLDMDATKIELLRKLTPHGQHIDSSLFRNTTKLSRTAKPPPTSELHSLAEIDGLASADTIPWPRTAASASAREPTLAPPQQAWHGYGPSFLVGKPVRLYCPHDNSYHIGRIIDWRSARCPYRTMKNEANLAPYFHGKGDVGTAEFLVRFAAGVNGRKQPLLRWIILEEHSLAVGLTLIWGKLQVHKSGWFTGWKPGQILVRTSLELIPVQHNLAKFFASCTGPEGGGGSGNDLVLALFFGEDTHAALSLRNECVGFFSPALRQQRNCGKVVVDSDNDCDGGNSNRNSRRTPGLLELEVGLALIEEAERKRCFTWHTLHIQDGAHPRALSLADESAIPPLLMGDASSSMEQDGSNEPKERMDLCEGGKPDDSVPNLSLPRLCPLIERGLDRIWLAQITGDGGFERSFDSIASMKCESVGHSDVPGAIATLLAGQETTAHSTT